MVVSHTSSPPVKVGKHSEDESRGDSDSILTLL